MKGKQPHWLRNLAILVLIILSVILVPNTYLVYSQDEYDDCIDDTPHGQCSPIKPLYCDMGILINRCDLCGCGEGMVCSDRECTVPESYIEAEIGVATLRRQYDIGEVVELTDPPTPTESRFLRTITDSGGEHIITSLGENEVEITNSEGEVIAIHTPLNQESTSTNAMGYIIQFKQKPLLERRMALESEIQEANETSERLSEEYDDISVEGWNAINPLAWGAKISKGFETDSAKSHLVQLESNLEPQMRDHERMLQAEHERFMKIFSGTSGVPITGRAIGAGEDEQEVIMGEYENVFNGMALNISSEEALRLAEFDEVEKVYPNREVTITLQDGLDIINAPYAWQLNDAQDRTVTGDGVRIAIIDTGIDYTHPDLGGCFGPGCRVVDGYDFINDDDDPMDDQGHGTHCAGIAAGNGVTKGVAPDAILYAYKVLNQGGSGTWDQVISGIDRAVDPNDDSDFSDHVDVISMSLGGFCFFGYSEDCGPDDAVSQAVDNAVEYGIVVVVAAGNNAEANNAIGSPGCARKVITVGATCKPDQIGMDLPCENDIAPFSSRGPVEYGDEIIEKPDIVAPGVLICSSQWEDSFIDRGYPQCYDMNHVALSGTSMATPFVAGAAALMLQKDPDLTPNDVKEALMNNAVDLGYEAREQGKGLIDVYASIDGEGVIMIEPTRLLFEINPEEETWSSVNSIDIHNLLGTQTTASLSASFEDAGIDASFSEDSITIASHGTESVQVTFTVNNDLFASRHHYEGYLEAQTSTHVSRVPVTFVIKDRVTLSGDDVKRLNEDLGLMYPSYYIDLGINFPSQDHWTKTSVIELSNLRPNMEFEISTDCCRMKKAQEYGDGYYRHLDVALDKNTIELDPGETDSFSFTIDMDNTDLWYENAIYYGEIYLKSPLQETVIPFEFQKYYIIDLHMSDMPIYVSTRTGEEWYDFTFYHERDFTDDISTTLYLDKDVADVVALIWKDYVRYYIVKEGVGVPDRTSLYIDLAEATHEVRLEPYDKDNNPKPLDVESQSVSWGESVFTYKDIQGSGTWYSYTPGSYGYYSDMSDSYTLNLGHMYIEDDDNDIYFYSWRVEGIEDDLTLTNNPSDLSHLDIEFHLQGRDKLFPYYWIKNQGLGSGRMIMITPEPFTKSLYMNEQKQKSTAFTYFQILDVEKPLDSGIFPNERLFESPLISNIEGILEKRDNDRQYGNPVSKIDDGLTHMGAKPEFWNGRFYNDRYMITINATGTFMFPFVTQTHDLIARDGIPYELYSDGTLIDSGEVHGGGYGFSPGHIYLRTQNPGEHLLVLKTEYEIFHSFYDANVRATFDTNLEDKDPPYFESLRVLSNGEPSDIIPFSGNNEISFQPADSNGEIASVEFYYSDGGQWLQLDLDMQSGEYYSSIPTISSSVYSFRIVMTDDSSNSLEYIFDVPRSAECGNNVRDDYEDCDGTDDIECPGECSDICQCPLLPKSQIVNTGSVNIEGYLQMKVQRWDRTWSDEDMVVNEFATSTLRTILPGSHLGLDNVWNEHGAYTTTGLGRFRVFAALLDNNGDVIVDMNDQSIQADYEFIVSDEYPDRCTDADRDGYYAYDQLYCPHGDDCNDHDSNINPGMDEICGNSIDDNCDGNIDEGCEVTCTDSDGGNEPYVYGEVTGTGDPKYGDYTRADTCSQAPDYQGLLFEQICNDDGTHGSVDHQCRYGCRDGACIAEGNMKDLSLYSEKEVFLVSDTDWKIVMPLVPVTTWTDEEGLVHKYPTLIFHEEDPGFDADSIIHFMQQYEPSKVMIIGDSLQELDNLLIAEPDLGAGLEESIIQRINPNGILNYWEFFDKVVYVDDDYELALLASTYASLINAPLVIQGTPHDSLEIFSGKDVICVGDIAPQGSTCSEQYTLEQLKQKYAVETNTDKVIIVNPDDLDIKVEEVFYPERTLEMINNIYGKTSLAAPLLASAKHELILSTSSIDYEMVDSFIESEIDGLDNIINYLTIIASPDAIPMVKWMIENSEEGYSREGWEELDNHIYSDINGDYFQDIAAGRIYGITLSDVSSYLARVLFYNDLDHSEDFALLWAPDQISGLKEGKSIEILLSEMGFNNKSIYVRNMDGPDSFQPSIDFSNKFYLNYIDHGGPNGGTYKFSTYDLNDEDVYLDSTIVLSAACLTCSYQRAYSKGDLFCTNIIRRGGIAYIGAIEAAFASRISIYFLQELANNNDLGNAFMNYRNKIILDTSILYDPYYILLGDPTFNPGLNFPESLDKTRFWIEEGSDENHEIFHVEIPEITNNVDIKFPLNSEQYIAGNSTNFILGEHVLRDYLGVTQLFHNNGMPAYLNKQISPLIKLSLQLNNKILKKINKVERIIDGDIYEISPFDGPNPEDCYGYLSWCDYFTLNVDNKSILWLKIDMNADYDNPLIDESGIITIPKTHYKFYVELEGSQ